MKRGHEIMLEDMKTLNRKSFSHSQEYSQLGSSTVKLKKSQLRKEFKGFTKVQSEYGIV